MDLRAYVIVRIIVTLSLIPILLVWSGSVHLIRIRSRAAGRGATTGVSVVDGSLSSTLATVVHGIEVLLEASVLACSEAYFGFAAEAPVVVGAAIAPAATTSATATLISIAAVATSATTTTTSTEATATTAASIATAVTSASSAVATATKAAITAIA